MYVFLLWHLWLVFDNCMPGFFSHSNLNSLVFFLQNFINFFWWKWVWWKLFYDSLFQRWVHDFQTKIFKFNETLWSCAIFIQHTFNLILLESLHHDFIVNSFEERRLIETEHFSCIIINIELNCIAFIHLFVCESFKQFGKKGSYCNLHLKIDKILLNQQHRAIFILCCVFLTCVKYYLLLP